METAVRNILRVGVYQLFHTDRIPPFAIVNEAVETARMIRPGVEGLVNAVLRNIIRKKEQIPWPELSGNVSKAISVSYSHPLWLVERLRKLHGTDETIAICRANNEIPPFTLRVNTLKATRENIIEQLKNEDIFTEPTLFSPEGITVSEGAAGLRDSVAFRQGLIRVQDEASQLVAHLLAPRPGARALDACAGSGGKTLHIGALMDNTGEIIATDINRSRLGMLTTEARRLGVSIVRTGMADDDGKSRAEIGLFDYVLVDAPCSGLGTLRRNPEIRWRLKESDIMLFQKKQMTLLKNAAEYVKPGGSLAYCVCTTTPEETTEVAAGFLGADSRFRVSAPRKLPVGIVTSEGFLLTLPHRHGLDGFFGALLMRQE
jgi:16S rRNA (cytosine967-C5)-methyltransferase